MLITRRFILTRQVLGVKILRSVNSTLNYSSSSDDKPDNENNKKEKARTKQDIQQTKNEATNKLNMLLKQMVEEDVHNTKSSINLAKPKDKRKSMKVEKPPVNEPMEKKVITAAKEVAESIGGDVKQTESELLSKLLNPITETASLSDIVKDMKIDRETKAPEAISRAEQVRLLLQRTKTSQRQSNQTAYSRKFIRKPSQFTGPIERIDLFGEKPLNILYSEGDLPEDEGAINKTWRTLYERELRLTVTHPPANYFQQLILWTDQGKLWKFPIDNEQGMEEEQNVYFTEHVFLEKHLEPWCPPKGPIRHFMELVCIGLSKNHYLSVQHKKDHIEWFKNYFEDKKQLLKDVGAIPKESSSSSNVKELQ